MDDERLVASGLRMSLLHTARRLSVRARATVFQGERVRPAVPADDTNRTSASQVAVPRIVMRNRRHTGQQVLQPSDEQPETQRPTAPAARRLVGFERRARARRRSDSARGDRAR
jgi:hypothetical protein